MFSSVGSFEQPQSAETARTDDTFSPGSFDVDEDVFDQLRGLPEILSDKVIQEYLRLSIFVAGVGTGEDILAVRHFASFVYTHTRV